MSVQSNVSARRDDLVSESAIPEPGPFGAVPRCLSRAALHARRLPASHAAPLLAGIWNRTDAQRAAS